VRNGHDQPKETSTMSEQAIRTGLDTLAKQLSASSGRAWFELRMAFVSGWFARLVESEKSEMAALERLLEIYQRAPHQYPGMSILSAVDYGVRAAVDGGPHLTRVAEQPAPPQPLTAGDLMAQLERDMLAA
jgi:hypothetical protein